MFEMPWATLSLGFSSKAIAKRKAQGSRSNWSSAPKLCADCGIDHVSNNSPHRHKNDAIIEKMNLNYVEVILKSL